MVKDFAGGERALEGHDVGVVHDADAEVVGIVPAADFSVLHVTGNFGDDGDAVAGAAIGDEEASIFRTAGIEDFAWDGAVLGEEGDFVFRAEGKGSDSMVRCERWRVAEPVLRIRRCLRMAAWPA